MMQCVSYVAVQNKDLITMVEKRFIYVQYGIYYIADHEVSNQNFGFIAILTAFFESKYPLCSNIHVLVLRL